MEGLILDTSSNRPFLLWTKEGKSVAFAPLESGEKLSTELGAKIKKFLPGCPRFIAIGTGPGSFTGVRVGVAIAKALAFGWEIPLLGFPSLQSFTPVSPSSPFAILADARMGGLYCQRENNPPELIPIESAPAALAGYALFSPHSAAIAKRTTFAQGIEEAEPNCDFLSTLCCKEALGRKATPFAPFPLAYLDGKP